jgi:hypothetical protein
MRATVPATCALVLLGPARGRAGAWTTVHSSDGGQSWTLSAEGVIEVTPDGAGILKMASDASLSVTSRGRAGQCELTVKPDADGRPLTRTSSPSAHAWRPA